jgi:outer membrane protein assembly factor BamB
MMKMKMTRPVKAAVLICFWCGSGFTADILRSEETDTPWTGWLGPQRNGWVEEFTPPQTWPAELQLEWSVEVGTGYGSPLVRGQRVYQHARIGEDEVVSCLDLEDGHVHWQQRYPAPFKMGGGGERHGKGPKSCPALADGRLFTLSIGGVLSAWDSVTGDLLWRRDYGQQFAPGHPYWGVSASPLVDGQRLIVRLGSDDRGALLALDVATGNELWRFGDDPPSYSSPVVADLHGRRQVIDWNQRVLTGVGIESGEPLWEFPFPQEGTNQNMPTPIVHRDQVLIGGENRGLRLLQPQVSDDTWTIAEAWFQKEVALDMSTAVMNGDVLFGFSHYGQGRLFCIDVNSGRLLWQGPGRTGDNAMFLSIPNYTLALINDGRLQVISASGDRYQPVATYRVSEGQTWAPPVLLHNGFLIKDDRTLSRWSFAAVPQSEK